MSGELDLRGLRCPLPVLKAAKALRNLPAGETLKVMASDPAAQKDFPAFCQTTGTELVESCEENGVYFFTLRKPLGGEGEKP